MVDYNNNWERYIHCSIGEFTSRCYDITPSPYDRRCNSADQTVKVRDHMTQFISPLSLAIEINHQQNADQLTHIWQSAGGWCQKQWILGEPELLGMSQQIQRHRRTRYSFKSTRLHTQTKTPHTD